MSDETNISVEPISDDLDTFSADFFGQKEAQPEPASSESDDHVDEESDAQDENVQTQDDDTDDEVEGEVDDQPKPKKSRAQERIEELNTKYRETERKLQELQAKFEQKQNDPTPEPAVKAESSEPAPTDLNEDGTDKYPLGEFDPNYIRDLHRHIFNEEMKAREEAAKADLERTQVEAAKAELQADWENKLGPARERYPDFQEKGENLVESFGNIDPAYGDYLAQTLMQMDHGPDVLYYLANNPDEAKAIVQSGALKATIALGKIEAKFAFAAEEKQKARPRVSNAPTPPPHLNKGSAVATIEVPDDTDDLDAFAAKLFKRGK